MKKLLTAIIGIAVVSASAFAQTKTVTTYGKHEKPKDYVSLNKGDMSLGATVSVFNRNDVTLQTGINAKWFLSKSWALRGSLRFGRDFAKGETPSFIFPDNTVNDPYDDYNSNGHWSKYWDKDCKNTLRKSTFMINIGAEHRHKLSNRFFGYYGADVALGGYGEILRAVKDGETILLSKQNRSCDIELLPFMGMECFIGPKISLSTEFGYDFLFKFYSKNSVTNKKTSEKEPQYNRVASHIDFGDMTFATLRLAYYF